MEEKLIEKIMEEVIKKVGAPNIEVARKEKKLCGLTEFVGTGRGDTIGLVIANVDSSVHEAMKLDKKYRSIGIIGGRTGAGPQIMAADEAVKATNTEILAIELPRDTKGGAGHGSLIIFGAEDVADARRAVEVALKELERTFGDVYGNEAGHLEFQYTARASQACEKAFNAELGKSFGLLVGAPAAIGVVLADTAVKAANVDVISYSSPASGTSFTNEVILTFSGDSGAVRQALIAAREVGIKLLGTLGSEPVTDTVPYI
ncbi:propanediol utilization microcompartment protein PduB [Schinkia azotoformans]|uniref:Propanediol utilization protein PduB n=1 Tax=Schinkia azotoformans LMG 9581 TaxID=1131731 RepID=K6C025_SCHAZ|nr:propanediol utilization microcompartment protein PduB [Schinkia azotoformans]EKN64485.1 propanediol utilization protein PduB [Schinkia azotoformans LMG 9581]MEC1640171.1 propanediol utilization microcompartment protein PduB [Schinkia azotoformans]MEC1945522.1 propanediol utilization microcompartment protein PduB [Schinkia azotoformans]